MGGYTLLIVATLIGFFLLAALLLAPVNAFLEREKELSEKWTPEKIAERLREQRTSTDGAKPDDAPKQPEAGP